MKHPVVLALVGLLVAGCSGDGDARVQVAEVGRATVSEIVDAPGTVGARATSAVAAATDAVVDQVLVKDGAQVTRGAVLVRLSSAAAQDRLRQALKAQAQAADTSIALPRADLSPLVDQLDAAAAASFAAGRAAAAQIGDPERRAQAERQVTDAEQRYAASSAAARAALEDANTGVAGVGQALQAVTGSQRAQAAAAVAAARATVEALTVRAPIAGVVTLGAGDAQASGGGSDLSGLIAGLPSAVQGQAEQALGAAGAGGSSTTTAGLVAGQAVQSGAPLLTVTDLGALTVTAEVDETDVLLVKPGTTAVVEVDAVPDATYPATVTAVDLAPATSSGGGVTYSVRLALRGGRTANDEPAPAPRPGMSAVVDLEVRTAKDVVSVPTSAVLRDEGRDVVFVVERGKAVRREVRTGAQGEDLVEVTAGLEPGARVVVRDADRLSDGQDVRT